MNDSFRPEIIKEVEVLISRYVWKQSITGV